MRAIALVGTVVFAAVIVLPLVALGALGGTAPYGGPLPAYPDTSALFIQNGAFLDRFGDATLARSPAKKVAISLRYRAELDLLHFVDTDQVISGTEGWLFYKGDFFGCVQPARYAQMARQLDVMSRLAGASGVLLEFAVAPNKSTTYADKLGPLNWAYTHCAAANTQAFDSALARFAPTVVRNSISLAEGRRRYPEINLFYHTDTHWTPFSAALAFRQLLATLPGIDAAALPPPKLGQKRAVMTDMYANMLIRTDLEAVTVLDPATEAKLPVLTFHHPVFLGDSFYNMLKPTIAHSFPGVVQAHIDDAKDYWIALQEADLIVASGVERYFLSRTLSGAMQWESPFGRALVARNETAAAATCGGFKEIGTGDVTALHNVEQRGADWAVTGDAPQLIFAVPPAGAGLARCLTIDYTAGRAVTMELFLPSAGASSFASGRSVQLPLTAGQGRIELRLPSGMDGPTIRLDPGERAADRLSIRMVALGTAAGVVEPAAGDGR